MKALTIIIATITSLGTQAQEVNTSGLFGYKELEGKTTVEDYDARREGKNYHVETGAYDYYIMAEKSKKIIDRDIEKILEEARIVILTNGYLDDNLDTKKQVREEMRQDKTYVVTMEIENYDLVLTFENRICSMYFAPRNSTEGDN